jgi:hypothetical protein
MQRLLTKALNAGIPPAAGKAVGNNLPGAGNMVRPRAPGSTELSVLERMFFSLGILP